MPSGTFQLPDQRVQSLAVTEGTYVLFMSHLSCARLMSKTLSRVSERHVMLS